jgi:hypothetical protein
MMVTSSAGSPTVSRTMTIVTRPEMFEGDLDWILIEDVYKIYH